jgi:RNA polymerase-interacting CarD/CdnL/TRCF family regulator
LSDLELVKQYGVVLEPHQAEMETQMNLTVGDKVVYPGRGPCLIGAVVEKMVCGKLASYYRLALLDDSRAELFVPVDKCGDINMRALLTRLEIPKLLEQLKTGIPATRNPGTAKNWRQRELDNLKLFNSGTIFELARMVESLTKLGTTKILAAHERETLFRARKLLICEISEVLGESKTAAEMRIDNVLERDKNKLN